MPFLENGIRTLDHDISHINIPDTIAGWKHYLKTTPQQTKEFAHKGIVICAGGLSYTTCAWINIKILRQTGCLLPIELWYEGTELSDEMIQQLSLLGNVVCKNFHDYSDIRTKGYALKPLAIVLSSFEEVLYLDSDIICCKDPSYLFNDKNYLEYGCLFWKDFWKTDPQNPIWDITQTSVNDEQEQESGQILINKSKCWKEISLCLYFNLNSAIYYKILFGDKDTFKFAWRAAKSTYYMIPHHPGICGRLDKEEGFLGNSIAQFDPAGDLLFLHRNILKWDITLPGELCWEALQTINSISNHHKIHFRYSALHHSHIFKMEGDIDLKPMTSHIQETVGKMCMTYLKELRDAEFYKNFLFHCYLRHARFFNNASFTI